MADDGNRVTGNKRGANDQGCIGDCRKSPRSSPAPLATGPSHETLLAIKAEISRGNEVQEKMLASLTTITEMLSSLSTRLENPKTTTGSPSDSKWMAELKNQLHQWGQLCKNAVFNEGKAKIFQEFLDLSPTPFIPRRCREWTDPRNKDNDSWKKLKSDKEHANVSHEIQKMLFYAEDQRKRMADIDEKLEKGFQHTSTDTQQQILTQWKKDKEMELNLHLRNFDKTKETFFLPSNQVSDFPGDSAGGGADFLTGGNEYSKNSATRSKNRGGPRPSRGTRRPASRKTSPQRCPGSA